MSPSELTYLLEQAEYYYSESGIHEHTSWEEFMNDFESTHNLSLLEL